MLKSKTAAALLSLTASAGGCASRKARRAGRYWWRANWQAPALPSARAASRAIRAPAATAPVASNRSRASWYRPAWKSPEASRESASEGAGRWGASSFLDARDCVLAVGPDLDTVPTSGNTSRQQAKILAVLNEPRLPDRKSVV